jgi:hypothetical protein
MSDFSIDPIAIDVGVLVQRSVASLYSSLITRPTGRAVRYAIESQLADAGEPALSLIDLSEVSLLDFSCADEVVAKLLLRYLADDRPGEAFFVFGGVGEAHRHAIDAALERQSLAAVARVQDGPFELIGTWSGAEGRVWRLLEDRKTVADDEIREVLPEVEEQDALRRLEARRLVFRATAGSRVHALSGLIRDLL